MAKHYYTQLALPEIAAAVEIPQINDVAEPVDLASPDEQHFTHQFEQEQREIFALMAPHEFERMIGKAHLSRIGTLLSEVCDRPFDDDGKLTPQGRWAALGLMHAVVVDLSRNIDDWLTYRVVSHHMYELEIPFE